MGTFSRISEEGLVRGGLWWIQRYLWLASDCNPRNSTKGNQNKNLFQVYLAGSRAQICGVLGPKIGPLYSLITAISAPLVFLLADLLFQLFHFTCQEIWAQTVLSCECVSLGNQKDAFLSQSKFLGQ